MVQVSSRLLKLALLETDERSKLEGELVSGIEAIKCSAWEVLSSNPTARYTLLDIGIVIYHLPAHVLSNPACCEASRLS